MTDVYQDDARAVDTINRLLGNVVTKPPKLGNRRMISAKLSQTAITGLKMRAKELGYVHNGDGNISMLLEAIGTQTITIVPPPVQARRLD